MKFDSQQKLIIKGVVIPLLIVLVILFGIFLFTRTALTPDYYEEAPNGVYEIHIVYVNTSNCSVFATLAVDAGDLHGFWQYDNGWELDKFFSYYQNVYDGYINDDFKVTLKNNIIVDIYGK